MRMAVFFRGIPPKSQTVVETRIDNAFHERVPALLNFQNIYNKIKEDKVREISYNVIYILIAMILLLIFVLFGVVTKL